MISLEPAVISCSKIHFCHHHLTLLLFRIIHNITQTQNKLQPCKIGHYYKNYTSERKQNLGEMILQR